MEYFGEEPVICENKICVVTFVHFLRIWLTVYLKLKSLFKLLMNYPVLEKRRNITMLLISECKSVISILFIQAFRSDKVKPRLKRLIQMNTDGKLKMYIIDLLLVVE